jgi:large subunit ribosomal protein L6
MSRIGKKIITLSDKVTLTVANDNTVTVKGPKGELSQKVDKDLKVEVNGNEVTIVRPTDQIRHRAVHGLTRALIANMVEGVTNGFKLELHLVGVGYRAAVTGQLLDMSLGYSHNIIFELPKEVTGTAVMEKGKPPVVTLESIDKQLVGQVAAKIRGLRKPEPYKGKGVRFAGEEVRRKAGKTAGK